MKRLIAGVSSLVLALMGPSQAYAYTSKTKAAAISVVASGVTPTQSLTSAVVLQNSGEPGTASTLTFGAGGNTYRDSGRAIRVDVNTNLAANRILFYTDNLAGGAVPAVPQCSLDTELGNDCGGLIGVTDRSQVVPLLWAVEDANPDFNFGASPSDGIGNEVYTTDRAHVTTYVDAALPLATAAEKQKLDTLAMKMCDGGAPVANADNAGSATDPQRYPQFFGSPGVANSDLCSASVSQVVIDPDGAGTAPNITINLNDKVNFSEELSKNIAVVAFSCLGTSCTAPNLSSPGFTKTVTSPFFMPLAADFRTAPGQDYASSTITVELVTQ